MLLATTSFQSATDAADAAAPLRPASAPKGASSVPGTVTPAASIAGATRTQSSSTQPPSSVSASSFRAWIQDSTVSAAYTAKATKSKSTASIPSAS